MARWIARTRLARFRGELPATVANRAQRWSVRDAVIVALDDGAYVGLGEASPLPGFSTDTVEACERALRDVHLTLGPAPDAGSIEHAVRSMVRPVEERLRAVPAARFALETALWSYVKLCTTDGSTSAERRLEVSNRSALRSVLLGGGSVDPESWAELARDRVERSQIAGGNLGGFKVKVGRADLSLERELAGVRALRAVLPSEFELRVDCNGAWSLDQAKANVPRLADAGANVVEEPCSGSALLALGAQPIPWLADESLVDPAFSKAVLDAPGCGGLVLKPMLLGGLIVCLDLMRAASSRGLRYALSHVFDGPIALKAMNDLAALAPDLLLPSALGWHEGLDAWPKRPRRSAPDLLGSSPPWLFYAISPAEWGLSVDA